MTTQDRLYIFECCGNFGRRSLFAGILALAAATMTLPGAAIAELDPATSTAILDALADERKSEAYYQAVIDRFGDVKPFSNIVGAERRHAEAIEKLCSKYGLDVPAPPTDGIASVPESVGQACALAIEAEERNIALYDELIPSLTEPDVRETFERLQTASRDKHLPAFNRCVQGGGQLGKAESAPGSCGQCGMGAGCGCSQASESEKKARAAAGGGCGCAKRAAQGN